MALAAIFLFLYSLILTISPAVRYHEWSVTYRWTQWIGYTVWLAGFVVLHHEVRTRIPERDPYLLPIIAMLRRPWVAHHLAPGRAKPALERVWAAPNAVMVLACVVVWLGIRYPIFLSWLRRYKYIWLTGGLLLMVLTTIIGIYPSGEGPGLWLRFGGLYIQPSEILKLLLVVYLAAYLADRVQVNLNLMSAACPNGDPNPAQPHCSDRPARPGDSFHLYPFVFHNYLHGFGKTPDHDLRRCPDCSSCNWWLFPVWGH